MLTFCWERDRGASRRARPRGCRALPAVSPLPAPPPAVGRPRGRGGPRGEATARGHEQSTPPRGVRGKDGFASSADPPWGVKRPAGRQAEATSGLALGGGGDQCPRRCKAPPPLPQSLTRQQTQLFSYGEKEKVVLSGKPLGKSFPCWERFNPFIKDETDSDPLHLRGARAACVLHLGAAGSARGFPPMASLAGPLRDL